MSDPQSQQLWSDGLAHTVTKPVIAVVMGVSGSGKTTVSVLLSSALGCQFQEGDDLHPAANVEKMSRGTPLTDADRLPWLQKIAEEIDGWRARGESGVLTCSALKRQYRDIIIGDRPGVALVYLKGSYELIRNAWLRGTSISCRRRYSIASLRRWKSPLGRHPIVVDVVARPAEIVAKIMHCLQERQSGSGSTEVTLQGTGVTGSSKGER